MEKLPSESCFLCGSGAERTVRHQRDQGALYKCSSSACGNYFLSDLAKDAILKGAIDRRPLSENARKARAIGQCLCIRVDVVTGTIKPEVAPQC